MHVRIIAFVLVSLIVASAARAEWRLLREDALLAAAEAAPTDTTTVVPLPREPFSAGSWALDFCGSHITHIRFSQDYFTTGSAGISYYLFDNLAFNLRVSGYRIDQPFDDAIGSSIDIGGRLHLLKIDRFTLYFDGGGSRVWTDTAVPEGGTTYNYIGRIGGGATWRMEDDVHFMAGVRFFHLSNGDEHGRINNPSYDGIEGYVGVMFTF